MVVRSIGGPPVGGGPSGGVGFSGLRPAGRCLSASDCIAGYTPCQLRITCYSSGVNIADRLDENHVKRKKNAAELSALTEEMFALIRQAYADGMPAPEVARRAGITRGRVYQIIRAE
ncbi:gp25 [Mycobacterium phage Ardmore]|uniref:Gp25 n=1 Tax=Mycobacterium phage Ardmore TaxID=2902838 RepID=D4N7H0_9CAUD|nr:HTH DNA binding protein [Mycobacterium phage Ardmore]ACY39907.1 gp25 [Mycobacterium phage Ardmore]